MNATAMALAAKINKEYGEGTIIPASQMRIARRYTSGSVAIDIALGGGWPANQWSEIIGKESHGKTAVTLKTIAANQAQDPNFTTLWVAAEHYDTEQAEALGVDKERVLVVRTQAAELALQTMLEYAESRSVDCVVLDSYPALIPDEEAGKDMDDFVVALGARLMGKFFRKAGAATRRSMTDPDDRPMLGLIINQYRDAIGQFSPQPGTPKTSPGGKAKNYAYYVQVEVTRTEYIDEPRPGKGKVRVGQTIKVKTVKNKSAAPQQIATVDFYFRSAPFLGFTRGDYDTAKELITMGVLFDVIKRGGAYFSYGDIRWHGRPEMEKAIYPDLTLQESIRRDVLEASKHVDEKRTIASEDIDAAENAGSRRVKKHSTEEAA